MTAWPDGAPEVGDHASMTRTVEPEDIVRFTAMSGDRNPVHYDADVAARTRLGGIVVQGGVTTAILNAVVAERLPGPGTVFLETHWRFLAPTRPGDKITGEVEVTSVRDDKPITTQAIPTTIRIGQSQLIIPPSSPWCSCGAPGSWIGPPLG